MNRRIISSVKSTMLAGGVDSGISDRRPLVFLALGLALLLYQLAFDLPLSAGTPNSNVDSSIYVWLAAIPAGDGLYPLPVGITVKELYQRAGLNPAGNEHATAISSSFTELFPGAEEPLALYLEDHRLPISLNAPARLMPFFYRPIPINRANKEELVLIKGIGPRLAERIIVRRNEKGAFREIDDLLSVSGLGSRKVSQLQDQVSFE